jgi:hypothetical protein
LIEEKDKGPAEIPDVSRSRLMDLYVDEELRGKVAELVKLLGDEAVTMGWPNRVEPPA